MPTAIGPTPQGPQFISIPGRGRFFYQERSPFNETALMMELPTWLRKKVRDWVLAGIESRVLASNCRVQQISWHMKMHMLAYCLLHYFKLPRDVCLWLLEVAVHVHREAIAKLGIFAGETREITTGRSRLGDQGMRGRTSEPQEPRRYWLCPSIPWIGAMKVWNFSFSSKFENLKTCI